MRKEIKEISALFAEQRLDIQMQQMRSLAERFGGRGSAAGRPGRRGAHRGPASAGTVDPAIDAQQQAIACRSRRTGCTGAGGRG